MPSLQTDSNCLLTEDYIKDVLRSPDDIINADAALSDKILKMSKWMFDKSKQYGESFSPLSELIVDGFDDNQIWEQILLEYEPKLSFFENLVAQRHSDAEALKNSSASESEAQGNVSEAEMSASDKEEESYSENEVDVDLDQVTDEIDAEEPEDEEISDVEEGDYLETESKDEQDDEQSDFDGVDDEFFSLKDMEKFADAMDERDGRDSNHRDSGSEMDFIDSELLFQDPDALVDDKDIENANDIRYEEFFGNAKKFKLKERRDKEIDEFSRSDKEVENENTSNAIPRSLDLENDSDSEDQEPKSRFEKQQEKLKKVITELEAEAVAEKDWALKGEVDASKRPKNSLLEQTLDVDYASKPVPVVTEESTASLEDIIKQRIKDELWDDVVRKVVIPEREFDPNKTRELNDAKNSKSLAEVYEEEYLKQTQDETFKGEKDEFLEKDHDEIKQLFNGLSQALDVLSNAYFTPKAPVLEVKVLPKLDVPAISLEEVIPATVSDAKLITPAEVYSAKIKKSEEEKDGKDHKRDRANFKAQQKKLRTLKEKARKDAEATKSIGRKRLSDEQTDKNKALEELMGQQNVTIISDKSNKEKLESRKGIKASVIQHGGKAEQEAKRFKTEHIKL